MPAKPQLVVFLGLGEDRRSTYTLQQLPFTVVPIDFIAPFRGESFSDYVERLAVVMRTRIDFNKPIFFAGISFGSAIAQEMTRHIRANGVVLISGYRSSSEIASSFRYLGRVVAPLLPVWIYASFIPIAPFVIRSIAKVGRANVRLLATIYRQFPKAWFREHCRMAVTWSGRAVDVPAFRIHGSLDPVIPCRGQAIDLLIDRDRHMCNLSHPELVNHAILQFVEACSVNDTLQNA